jgi:hypothetical protein
LLILSVLRRTGRFSGFKINNKRGNFICSEGIVLFSGGNQAGIGELMGADEHGSTVRQAYRSPQADFQDFKNKQPK